jgi:hypothetical protein
VRPPNEPEFGSHGEVLSAVDWLGQRFGLGDVVIYCIAAGKGQMLALGRVVDFEYIPEQRNAMRPAWVRAAELYVRVLTERTSGRWNNVERSAPAWVNPMNVTLAKGVIDL